MDKIKVIQTRLKRKGIDMSREEIRGAIAHLGDDFDLDTATNHILSMPAKVSKGELSVREEVALTQEEQIKAVAEEINIDLPVEAIKQIAGSIEFAVASREELHGQLVVAIREWANHKISALRQTDQKLNQQTEELFEQVNRELGNAIANSNSQIEQQAEKFTNSVNNSVERFRTQQAAILERFKVR